MKLLCISDIHDQWGDYKVADLPEADAVLVAGDLTDYGLQGEALGYGELNRARTWLRAMGARYRVILWIPGNHDIGVTARTFDDIPGVICALNQTGSLCKFTLFGVSQTVCFDQPSLKTKWDYMTDDLYRDFIAFDFPRVDIVLSHGPPKGILDGPHRQGSPGLRSYIQREQPRLVVCGHVHEDGGKEQVYRSLTYRGIRRETRVVNCACVPMLIEISE